jgi:hypothetical protein
VQTAGFVGRRLDDHKAADRECGGALLGQSDLVLMGEAVQKLSEGFFAGKFRCELRFKTAAAKSDSKWF